MGNECIKLKPEILQDLCECTTFSAEEITERYKAFIRDFPRGQVSIEDIKEMYRGIFPNGNSSKFACHVFRTFDTNRDGVIDFREFLLPLYAASRGTKDQKLKWTFKMFDVDGNGYITPEEMRAVLRSYFEISGEPVKEFYKHLRKLTSAIFKILDINSDGRITLDEFIEIAKNEPSVLVYLQYDPLCLFSQA